MNKLINKFIRDVTKVTPMPKSEVRERLTVLMNLAHNAGFAYGMLAGEDLAERLGRDLRKLGKKK